MKPCRITILAAATVIMWTFATAAIALTEAEIRKEARLAAQKLIDDCWAASLEKRSNPDISVIRSGILDTVLCLEDIIENQFKLYPKRLFTPGEVKERLKALRFSAGRLYWYIYNENPGCDPTCGLIKHTYHLSSLAKILETMIHEMIVQRKEYGF